jgi:hypothetical protein
MPSVKVFLGYLLFLAYMHVGSCALDVISIFVSVPVTFLSVLLCHRHTRFLPYAKMEKFCDILCLKRFIKLTVPWYYSLAAYLGVMPNIVFSSWKRVHSLGLASVKLHVQLPVLSWSSFAPLNISWSIRSFNASSTVHKPVLAFLIEDW